MAPLLTLAFLKYFNNLKNINKTYLEIGSGKSTIYFSHKFKKVISLENNKEYFDEINKIKPKNVDLILFNKDNINDLLTKELEKKPENLFVEAEPYFDDWTDGNYSFDTLEKTIKYIESTDKGDLLELMNKMFLEGQYMNTTIQIRGDDYKDTPFFNW